MQITIDNVQDICDAAGQKRRRGGMSPQKYIQFLNFVENSDELVRTYIRRHMRNRMDPQHTRTLGEFAEALMLSAISQEVEICSWVTVYAHLHFPGTPFEILDNGIDNRGFVIIERQDRNAFKEPDYLLKSGTHPNVLLEYKDCPCDFKATYKVGDLENAVQLKAHILTIHKKAAQKKFYTVMSPQNAAKMLEELEVRNRWEVGHKPSVQMFVNKNFKEYLQIHKFNS